MKTHPLCCLIAAVLCIILLASCTSSPGGPEQSSSLPIDHDMITSPPPVPEMEEGGVQIFFINVGRADATLVKTPEGDYLIDTGEKTSAPRLLGALKLMEVKELTGVFLTHTHSDHIGGLEALAENIPIQTVYFANISEPNKNGEHKLTKRAGDLFLDYKTLDAGDTVAGFEVLGPLTYNDQDDNDNSLVLKYRANGKTLLFTGDMQFAEEQTLLDAKVDLSADVLKVANHGNPDAISDAFARAVSPSVAVIPTDTAVDTDSANPHVLKALQSADTHITQDYSSGVLLSIAPGGNIKVYDPPRPESGARLLITGVDKDAQTVTLKNDGALLDLSGYMVFSEKGSELYVFQQGAIIAQGQSITLACEGGSGDYIWPDKKVWSAKKADPGVLYDPYGGEIDRFE